MSIALVAAGADSNGTGASLFCGFVQPIGIKNGDLVLCALALPAAGITVTPPDESWTQVVQTDPSQTIGLSVWWAPALNLPSDIVFALSASVAVSGVLVAYRGTDDFGPIEAYAAQLTAAATSHGVASSIASQSASEAVLFIAGAASGTYSPASGFIETARSQRTGCTVEAQHKGLQNAGPITTFSETFSASAAGVSVLVVLAPSASTLTYDDVYQRLFEALPKGVDNLLDFTPGAGDFYFYFWCIASILKLGYDLVDIARQEIVPFLSRYKLPDWERLFALTQSRTAQTGTIPQRQNQVLSAWRGAAGQGSALSVVQATLAPLLGYFPSTIPLVLEPDVDALRLEHTYSFVGDIAIANTATGTATFVVNDGGKVGAMGAQLQLAFSMADLSSVSITLTGPDNFAVTWNRGWSTAPLRLFARAFAGHQILGRWTLAVTNNSGASIMLLDGSTLFVEGIARGQQTGGAIFEAGIYADPAHLGENGNPPDFGAARIAMRKLAQSHTVGNLIQSLDAWPDTPTGAHACICDEFVPS